MGDPSPISHAAVPPASSSNRLLARAEEDEAPTVQLLIEMAPHPRAIPHKHFQWGLLALDRLERPTWAEPPCTDDYYRRYELFVSVLIWAELPCKGRLLSQAFVSHLFSIWAEPPCTDGYYCRQLLLLSGFSFGQSRPALMATIAGIYFCTICVWAEPPCTNDD